jgi:hypothetical protein
MKRWLVLALVTMTSSADADNGIPAPSANAARVDVPAGAVCRIGSELLGSSGPIKMHGFSSADRLLLATMKDWRVFDATTGARLESFALPSANAVSPTAMCFLNYELDDNGDGTMLSGTVQLGLYSTAKRARTVAITMPWKEVYYSDWELSDDCSLVIQRIEKQPCIKLRDAALRVTGELCTKPENYPVVVSGDGRSFAHAERYDTKSTIRVYDAKTRKPRVEIAAGYQPANAFALSRDGALVAFSDGENGQPGVIRIVQVSSGREVSRFAVPAKHRAHKIVFSAAGDLVAFASDDWSGSSEVSIVDVATGKPRFRHHLAARPPDTVAFSPDGSRFAYDLGTSLRLIDTKTGKDLAGGGRLFAIESSAASARGDKVAISSIGYLSIWNTQNCKLVKAVEDVGGLRDMRFVDAHTVLGQRGRDWIKIDLRTGKQTPTVEPTTAPPHNPRVELRCETNSCVVRRRGAANSKRER